MKKSDLALRGSDNKPLPPAPKSNSVYFDTIETKPNRLVKSATYIK